MHIALDVDGPVADIHTEWLRRYNLEYDDTLVVADIKDWDFAHITKPECGKLIYDILKLPDFYSGISPKPGALDAIAQLQRAGHRITFATACGRGMMDQKADWMVRQALCVSWHNSTLPPNFAPVTDKSLIDADVLIDDGIHNINGWTAKRRRSAILMTFPWNAGKPVANEWLVNRAATWPEIVKLIEGTHAH